MTIEKMHIVLVIAAILFFTMSFLVQYAQYRLHKSDGQLRHNIEIYQQNERCQLRALVDRDRTIDAQLITANDLAKKLGQCIDEKTKLMAENTRLKKQSKTKRR